MFDTLPIPLEEPPGPSAGSAAPDLNGSGLNGSVDPREVRRLAEEWAECSGAVLAKMVAEAMSTLPEIPDGPDGDQQIFDLITANARLAARATANQARLTAMVHQRAWHEHRCFGLVQGDAHGTAAGPSHQYDDVAYTSAEIAGNLAMELGQPMPVAEREVRFALGLTRDDDVRLALAGGRMDVAQARAVVDELSHVPDPAVRGPVVRALVSDPNTPDAAETLVRELRPGRKRLWDLTPAELRSIIRRETQRLDPTLSQDRARAARSNRHVRFHPRRDAMAELVLHGPAEVMAATYQHLNLTAHAVRHQHGQRSEIADACLAEIRHDIAVGWLTQGEHGLAVTYRHDPADPVNLALPAPRCDPVVLPSRPHVTVNVTVSDSTLLGLDELPGTLHTPPDLARELAYGPEHVTWRRILCDPSTGVATDVSRNYRPPPRIAEFVRVRDGLTSRFPGSTATQVELDHILRYRWDDPDLGGPTKAANLGSVGQREHHLKTDGAITAVGDANGPLIFRGRAGRDHLSWPHQYREPAADNGDPPY
jgi:hypothetical protein